MVGGLVGEGRGCWVGSCQRQNKTFRWISGRRRCQLLPSAHAPTGGKCRLRTCGPLMAAVSGLCVVGGLVVGREPSETE